MAKEVSTAQKSYKKTQPVRLYAKGVFTGYRRGQRTQRENQAVVHIQNCQDIDGAKWYLGKRVAYVYKAKNVVNNTKYRCNWGKVVNTHGHAGAVRVRFAKNICPRAMGSTVRVMLYPNKTI